MFTPGRILALFVAGGIGLALCDQIHVQAGVLDYETGGFFGQAWWVPLQFGVAAVAIVAGVAPFARGRAKPGAAAFVTGTLWFVAAYAASGLFDAHPYALAAAFVVTWAVRVALARQPASLVAFSLLLAAAGTGAEAILSAAGTFAYTNPNVLGVPIWLPGLYLHGAPLALALSRALSEPRVTRSAPAGAPAPPTPPPATAPSAHG
jgi:hypothetical protein